MIHVDEFVATRWACGYCERGGGNGPRPPFCCASRRSELMIIEEALKLGKLAIVDARTGECELSPLLQMLLAIAGPVALAVVAWALAWCRRRL